MIDNSSGALALNDVVDALLGSLTSNQSSVTLPFLAMVEEMVRCVAYIADWSTFDCLVYLDEETYYFNNKLLEINNIFQNLSGYL